MKLGSFARLLVISLLLLVATAGWAFAGCQKGDKAEVLWKGTWYAATVLHNNGERCFIHYDGYESSWDEWVGPDRIRIKGAKHSSPKGLPPGGFQEGDPVQVLWKGTWYGAHVLKSKGAQTYIHYDGYDNSWDEWVGPDRIRPLAGAMPPPPPPAGRQSAGPPPSSGGFDGASYTCAKFLADSDAKSPMGEKALDYAVGYFAKRSGQSPAAMDANARIGLAMALGMECPGSPQASWDSILQKVYDSAK